MDDKKSQGIVRDERDQEQPADKKRAQHVTSVEEKKKIEDEIQKTARKAGSRTCQTLIVISKPTLRKPFARRKHCRPAEPSKSSASLRGSIICWRRKPRSGLTCIT